ncbi:SAM-dependent chlorinase/fluorinase [filamentous cyanobacterium LEGE 11480]|uniref:SAM-dependent chlorinase/fluorinase n=1 Tax=Romeriopsis navalis LEGE 11480 TaxID=2777977 RepID=A0A928VRZ6_9CYAN|nr:SAM-dependent chlorinase/fluorinase [Romeriopsis navalis]MBE9031886.1 SAM-dependent chlorinase/fluorinase [Romeriopsis navalis LEGE 11480]
MKTLTLLTDFGTQDAYVGIMKGVITTIAPTANIIDISHNIPPQDIITARFQLMTAFPYFPEGTIHVVVVDPGVGSNRRAIALQFPSGYIIVPDNGIIGGVLGLENPIATVELNDPLYWLNPQPSNTFHGRDIFAPVAAHLANGIPMTALGTTIDWQSLVQMPIPTAQWSREKRWEGCIQAIDHFGNLITNLRGDLVTNQNWSVDLGEHNITGHTTYANARHKEPVGLVSSDNWIEIAIRNGNAEEYFTATIGDKVKLTFESSKKVDS